MKSMIRDRGVRAWEVGFYFILFGLLFHRFWGSTIIYRDSFHLFAPLKYYVAEGWRTAQIYGWYPWQYLGMPFAGNVEAGWFYPLNVFYLLLPFEPAHRLFILIHYPLAALFFDLLLRELGLPSRSRLFASLAFALSGYLLSMHSMFTMLLGPAWAPLALFFFLRSHKHGLPWAAGAGVVLAVQVLAGDPQNAYLTALLIGFLGLIRVNREFFPRWLSSPSPSPETERRRLRPLFALAVCGLSAFGFSAVQLLPAWEHTQHTARGGGLPFSEAVLSSLHPAQLLEFVWPTPFGVNWPEYYYWGRFALDFPDTINVPWAMSNYLGLPVIVLAGTSLVLSRRRLRWALGAGILVYLLLALGQHTPFYGWCYHLLPGFDLFRYPAKFTAWLTGFMAAAAGLGIEALEERLKENPSAGKKAALIYVGVVLAAAAAGAWFWPEALARISGWSERTAEYQTTLFHLKEGGWRWLAVNLAASLLLFLSAARRPFFPRAALLFLALQIADWYSTSVSIMPAAPARLFSSPSSLCRVLAGDQPPAPGRFRVFRLTMEFPDSDPQLKSFPLMVRRRLWEWNTLGRNFGTMQGFEDLVGYSAARPAEGLEVLQKALDRLEEGDPSLLALYNVEYLLADLKDEKRKVKGARQIFAREDTRTAVFRLQTVWPRVYWVPTAVPATEAEAIKLLEKTDLRRAVIITTPEKVEPPLEREREMIPCRLLLYEPDRVVIESEADTAGWVVLNDREYPGWRAKVDGRPARIYRANLLVRAVPVPPGRHTVEFFYEPSSLRAGAGISILACIIVFSWTARQAAVRWKRGRA